jgi:plastocyanin
MRRLTVVTSTFVMLCALLGAPPASAGGGGAGCDHGGELTDARTTEVSLVDLCFTPNVVRTQQGETVTFVNDDPMLHFVGGVYDTMGEEHKMLRAGEKVSYTFSDEGVFPFVCILHPGMIGAVVVGDGIGPATNGSSSEGMVVPPSDDSAGTEARGEGAARPASQTATARDQQKLWLLATAVLIALALAGALWLPRRKTQPEI